MAFDPTSVPPDFPPPGVDRVVANNPLPTLPPPELRGGTWHRWEYRDGKPEITSDLPTANAGPSSYSALVEQWNAATRG
jgi:hypothetical protein